MKHLSRFIVVVLLISLTACPPAQKKPATPATPAPESALQKATLKYKFTVGIIKYRFDEEGVSSLNISAVSAAQSVKAISSAVVRVRTLQPPMDGYAFIEQAMESYSLQIWQNDSLVFDSSRFKDFSGGQNASNYLSLKNKVFKFEMNEYGAIRNIQGLGEIKFGQNSLDSLKMLESGQPVFPEGEIAVGQSWENRRQIPFDPTAGYRGEAKIKETSSLESLRKDGATLLATINVKRDILINVYQSGSGVSRPKGFDGVGQLIGKYIFDVNAGRIVGGDTRMNLKVTAILGTAAPNIETSIDMQLTSKVTLIGQ